MNKSLDGALEWSADAGWDEPYVETKDRGRFKDIDVYLYRPGLLCRIAGGQYMFVDTSNYWCNLASIEAMGRINAIVGITNATVNIDKSMKQFLKYIIKRCDINVGRTIPTSVCFGTRRLEVHYDDKEQELTFTDCRPLVRVVSKKVNPAVMGVCIMPVDTNTIPSKYMFPGKGDILRALIKLFPDARSFATILWHIGNCLVDPVSRPKCLMLCGPGGSGKSTVLEQINAALVGCCGIIPDGSLVGRSRSMSSEIAEVITSYRMALCYDVDLEDKPLNMAIFKNISGSDSVRVGFNSIKTHCSLTLGTNGVVDITEQPEYLEDAIMRRTASVLMNVNALEIPTSIIPEDTVSRMDFACAAIAVRLQYDHMPISPMNLLLSLCQSKIDSALEYVSECTGPLDYFGSVKVLDVLANVLNISPSAVVFKARLISPLAVVDIHGRSFLRGLTVN